MRAFELINKTNQFNLNGRRWKEPEWRRFLGEPGAFLVTASYEDKFGPLGEIAAMLGTAGAGKLSVDAWVMSCRAFSRRIEHQCLKYLFERLRRRNGLRLPRDPAKRAAPEFLRGTDGESA